MRTRIEKTTGLVLNMIPVSETSMTVHWLTQDFGWMATLIKGAQRPKSGFLGQVDLFYECELLFYLKPTTSLHLAREISADKRRDHLRRDFRACAMASYYADLATRISISDAPNNRLFQLMQYAFDMLESHGAHPNGIHWVEMKILELHGLAPSLQTCCRCGNPVQHGGRKMKISIPSGGVICSTCSERSHAPGIQVGPDVVSLMQNWQKANAPRSALLTRCTEGQHLSVNRIMGQFLEYHLDTQLKSRELAFQAAAWKSKAA